MTNVLVADDHPIVLEGLSAFLGASGYKVTGRCRSGLEVLDLWQRDRPDLLILDINMPDLGGIELSRRIRAAAPQQKIVLLTSSILDAEVTEAIRVGVDGIVLKESAASQLIACLRAIESGRRWIDPEVAQRVVIASSGSGSRTQQILTPRELEVTRLVSAGLRNRQIAQELRITEGTVKMYLHGIYEKLDVTNRIELANVARERGLLQG